MENQYIIPYMRIIKLKQEISPRKSNLLDEEIKQIILLKNGKVTFWGLGKNKRSVFFDKYLEATKRLDKNRRRQKFLPALELIRKVKKSDIFSKQKTQLGLSYGFKGVTPNGI